MHKSSHFDKSISCGMNYVISKYSPSLDSCNPAVLPYVSYYINNIIILLKQDYKIQLANNKIQMAWITCWLGVG